MRFFVVRLSGLLRMAAFILLASVANLRAEATVEMFSDGGFDIPEFTFDNAGFNANFDQDPNPPEGRKVLELGIAGNGGGWGMANGGISNRTAYTGGALRFWLKSQHPCTVIIDDGRFTNNPTVTIPSTNNQWQEIVLPLDGSLGTHSFNHSVNLNNVLAMFTAQRYNFSGQITMRFDDIRWTKAIAGLAVYPKTTTVNPGTTRQFTVEGYDAIGAESIFLYNTYPAPSSLGYFIPGPPFLVQSSTFVAGTTSGSLPFNFAALSTAAVINNTTANLARQFGVLSETVPGLQLNVDSFMGTFQGGGANIVLNTSNTDFREGTFSHSVSVNVPNGGFAGFFVQEGLQTSNDFVTRDMNQYYEGSVRFWFKAPPTLQNVMILGIRSGNVRSGREISKVDLRNYVAFDNNWHPVAVPIRVLAGPRPWADIARTKTYATFGITGNTSGPQLFFVDNITWDTSAPGPLARVGIIPNPVNAPLNSSRILFAKGYDANGLSVDIYPSWSISGPIGTLSTNIGPSSVLSAVGTPANGSITITEGSFSSTTIVNVADPVWTQFYNVYSDVGSGGAVGSANNNGSNITLSEVNLGTGVAPEGATVRRADYSITNNTTNPPNGFVSWFTNVNATGGSRYMGYFDNGYLSFWVKTSRDLEISIRSTNILPGAETSKIRLSELGIPRNNTFQRVVIPMADFRARDPNLDFNQIQTYFAIADLAALNGIGANLRFEVDDVKWLTAAGGIPDPAKVLGGLRQKQQASGLLKSYETLPQAATYDQALAAMAFTYHLDLQRARNIFNVYQGKYTTPFTGFHDEYDAVTPSLPPIDSDRVAGPNAWMLLALLHYRTVSGDTQYDTMMDGIAGWLLGLQDTDGAIKFGFAGGVHPNEKATEHSFDCYSAFNAYADTRNAPNYRTAANNIATWLRTEAYMPTENRFGVGEYGINGQLNSDRALDAYSWAPLAMSSYTIVLTTAIPHFGNTKVCEVTGLPVTGFDFSGLPGQPVDKDAVWLEGTAQMAVAFYATENSALGDFYSNQMDAAVKNISATEQGIPYATNGGTAYGFNMNSQDTAVSPAVWYLFAKRKFNPLQPLPLYGMQIRNVSNNQPASTISFNANVPTRWVRSSQYIRFESQPVSIAAWGVQIYTNNTAPSSVPRYVDPTPTNTTNPDSDPAGLGWLIPTQSSTTHKLPLAWRIMDSSGPAPAPIAPYTLIHGGSGEAFNWSYTKDRATPAIDSNGNGSVLDPEDGRPFADGEEYIRIRDDRGIHASQGSNGFFPSYSPDYIYLESDFGTAATQQTYQTNSLLLEFFLQ